jgi:hypothetical protein
MEESQVGPKRLICAAAAVAGVLATASPAMAAANTYCVSKSACTGIAVADFQSALNQAKAHPGPDTVELGAGDFSTAGQYSYLAPPHNPVDIVGEGADQTRLVSTQGGSAVTLTLTRGTVSDLEIAGPPSHEIAAVPVALRLTGHGDRLKLTGGWVNLILEKGASVAHSTLTQGGLDLDRPAVLVQAGQATLTDSTVDGLSAGVHVSGAGVLRVERSTITAQSAVNVTNGGVADVHDSLLRGKAGGGSGIVVYANGAPATAYATNVTIVGVDTAGATGVTASALAGGVNALVVLRNSVITRTATSLRREATSGSAYVTATNSAYDPATVVSTGAGTLNTFANIGAAPGFVDAPGGDFHLAPRSPLIDAGDPAPGGGLGDLDLDGMARPVDGDANGSVLPDIGAFEYQPPPASDVPDTRPPVEPPTGDPQVPQADLTAPVVSSLKLTHRRFRAGRATTARVAAAAGSARGTAFRFRLSEDARVRVVISRRVHGKRRAAGQLVRAGRKGANRIAFTGRLGNRALKPGRYAAAVTAVDAAGRTSATRRATFIVLR